MGLIFWIDGNTFATTLLEKVFKNQGLSFYTIQTVDDFLYLVEDLKPVVIVLDYPTFLKNKGRFFEQLNSSEMLKNVPFILVDGIGGESELPNVIGEIKRPFDPFEIPNEIKKIISQQ
jgi:DNA-binding NtrC family response regulator